MTTGPYPLKENTVTAPTINPKAEPRRATEWEIRTARAWVDETMPGWTNDSDTDRQGEYETALEVVIFANGGRYAPPRFDEMAAKADRLRSQLADVLRRLDAETEWQISVTERVPQAYEASDGSRAACIDHWLDDVCRIVEAALDCRQANYNAESVGNLDRTIAAAPSLDPRADVA